MKIPGSNINQGYTVIIATAYLLIAEALLSQINKSKHRVIGIITRSSSQDVISWATTNNLPIFVLPIHPDEGSIAKRVLIDSVYAAQVDEVLEQVVLLSTQFIAIWGINVLPSTALSIPSIKCLNIHPSDLPRYQGGFPFQAQILNGEQNMRISIHETTTKVDCGPVLNKSSLVKIDDHDTMLSLLKKCLPVGASLLVDTLDKIIFGNCQLHQQFIQDTHALPHAWGVKTELSQAPSSGELMLLNHGLLPRLRIDWDVDSAIDIERCIRAFDMVGGPYTNYFDEVVLLKAAYAFTKSIIGDPGEIIDVMQDGSVVVQARDAVMTIAVEFKSKKKLPLSVGERFASTLSVSRYTNIKNSDKVNKVYPT